MTGPPIYFNPHADGLEVFLGPTETDLMELLWRKGEVSVKSALLFLPETPKRAYTTVMTVLNRLVDKGLLQRRKQGRNYLYRVTVDRDDFIKSQVDLVRSCLKRNFGRSQ